MHAAAAQLIRGLLVCTKLSRSIFTLDDYATTCACGARTMWSAWHQAPRGPRALDTPGCLTSAGPSRTRPELAWRGSRQSGALRCPVWCNHKQCRVAASEATCNHARVHSSSGSRCAMLACACGHKSSQAASMSAGGRATMWCHMWHMQACTRRTSHRLRAGWGWGGACGYRFCRHVHAA